MAAAAALRSWLCGLNQREPSRLMLLALVCAVLLVRSKIAQSLDPHTLFDDPDGYDPDAMKKHLSLGGVKDHVTALRGVYEAVEWTESAIEAKLRLAREPGKRQRDRPHQAAGRALEDVDRSQVAGAGVVHQRAH